MALVGVPRGSVLRTRAVGRVRSLGSTEVLGVQRLDSTGWGVPSISNRTGLVAGVPPGAAPFPSFGAGHSFPADRAEVEGLDHFPGCGRFHEVALGAVPDLPKPAFSGAVGVGDGESFEPVG